MSASDLAAQREARRRKITQNAKARMNRLLGQPDSQDTDLNASKPLQPHDNNRPTQPIVPSSQPGDEEDQHQSPTQSVSPYKLRRRSQRSESPSVSPVTESVLSRSSTLPPGGAGETQSAGDEISMHAPTQGLKTENGSDVKERRTLPEPRPQASRPCRDRPAQSAKSWDAKSLELLRLVACVVTAFLARYTLQFGFGLFMVESIFLPFVGMEALFVYTTETYFKGSPVMCSKNTLISAALMLCGLKPELMDVYHKIMAHVTMVTSDFGVFLFSFVLWHSIMA